MHEPVTCMQTAHALSTGLKKTNLTLTFVNAIVVAAVLGIAVVALGLSSRTICFAADPAFVVGKASHGHETAAQEIVRVQVGDVAAAAAAGGSGRFIVLRFGCGVWHTGRWRFESWW